MPCYKVLRVKNGYRVALSGIFRARLVRLYPTSNEKKGTLCEVKTVRMIFSAISAKNFFHLTCISKHKKHDWREPGLFNEEFHCTEIVCQCSETFCCFDSQSSNNKCSSKRLIKRMLEDTGDGPCPNIEKFWKKLVMKHHQKCVFTQSNMLFSLLGEQRRKCHTFISNEKCSKMEFTLVPLIYNYRQFNIKFQYLCVTSFDCFCCQVYFLIKFSNLKSIFFQSIRSKQYPQAS